MKSYFFFPIICLAIVAGLVVAWNVNAPHSPAVRHVLLKERSLTLEIATTDAEQYQGLSDRQSICPSCGMLFVFNDSAERTFVMRRMHFPLDIVWINDGVIEKIDYNLSPEMNEPYTLYRSGKPVNRVLELPAGGAQSYNLQSGERIDTL